MVALNQPFFSSMMVIKPLRMTGNPFRLPKRWVLRQLSGIMRRAVWRFNCDNNFNFHF